MASPVRVGFRNIVGRERGQTKRIAYGRLPCHRISGKGKSHTEGTWTVHNCTDMPQIAQLCIYLPAAFQIIQDV